VFQSLGFKLTSFACATAGLGSGYKL